MDKTPTYRDALILCVFVVLITLQPYYLHDDIIMMETGIHLPGINAVFHGAVPYRDFFFLRGPLELYVPAFLMLLFGKNLAVLPTFYYLGTVLTLLLLVLLAKQFYRVRLIFYLMVPVLVGRTFPRISYNYWGGMRYFISLLSVLFLVIFLKKQRLNWIFWTGIISGLALLTTIEAGFCSVVTVGCVLVFSFIFNIQDRRFLLKSAVFYSIGILGVVIPFLIYLIMTQSLRPILESIYTVVTNLYIVFPNTDNLPLRSVSEFLSYLLPTSRYFKVVTPIFCYLFLTGYFILKMRKKALNRELLCVLSVAVYGMILYLSSFRRIEGNHFEMALQPEKILLFFLIQEAYLFLKGFKARIYSGIKAFPKTLTARKDLAKIYLINFLFVALVISSVTYSVARYNRRFISFELAKCWLLKKELSPKLRPLEGMNPKPLNTERAYGLVLPGEQADEITEVVRFIQANTKPDEIVFTYAELGTYNFIFDRPFVGRFPVATASWLSPRWHRELMEDLKKAKPRFVVMTNIGDKSFPEKWYFQNKDNVDHFKETTVYILNNYMLVESVGSVGIYRLKS